MAEVKHTPWEVVPANEHHGFYVEDVAGRTVCDLYVLYHEDIDEAAKVSSHLNAAEHVHLLAAAPELKEALEKARHLIETLDVVADFEPEDTKLHISILGVIDAALAKANGEGVS